MLRPGAAAAAVAGCDSLQQQTGGRYGEVVERVACAVPPNGHASRDGPVAARVVHHGVRTLDDPIAAALSVRQAANLTQRFWPRLPPLLQSKWRGALREYLEYVL